MDVISLKKADLHVSKIGLGTNAVGGHNLFTDLDEEQGKRMIAEALHQGITFFDTADVYGFGRSEELLGEMLKNNRTDVVIATKGGVEQLSDGKTRINNHPSYLRNALEKSLQRLQTDFVDLYYIHFPDQHTPLAESIGELTRFKEEGKIRAIGISNVNLDQLNEANQHNDITVLQSPYHMLDRRAEKDLLPYCIQNEISFIPYGPLAYGILGGKYTEDFKLSEKDWRKDVPLFQEETFKNNLLKVEQLKQLAAQKKTSLPNLALSWLLAQNGIDTVIPGGKRPEQVIENAKACDVHLSENDLETIERILVS
ncbi:aldo/keto reductase [Melghirimyces algeriensis]|uniref:Predicted oxidoreductase n=1 Tax=Melghirimyces algeriensis TaxID=910412 RepID=A0A521CB73_9BACL|nr:aldo/keto reductase [Melghirimyces algeriensis]SMO56679.1 Predicted oxidoreductase [Melghirimyces algeriensis]